MKTATEQLKIQSVTDLDWIDISLLPGVHNTWVRVAYANPETMRVALEIKFGKNGYAPKHFHYCRATVFTREGRWAYDDGESITGDFTIEEAGGTHTPYSAEGAILNMIFDGDAQGRFLDNYLEDGTVIPFNINLFTALCRISSEDAQKLDWMALLSS